MASPAFTPPDGRCSFRKDVYERDPRTIAALDGPIMVHKEHEAGRDRRIKKLKENRQQGLRAAVSF